MTWRRFHVEDRIQTPQKVNLRDKLALFDEHWSPRLVGAWHQHEDESV
jgi:hypothetical protein